MILVAPLCPQKEWFKDLAHVMEESLQHQMLWNLLIQPHMTKFHKRLESLHLLTWKLSRDFPKVAEITTMDLRSSTACLCQGKKSRDLHWFYVKNITSCKATYIAASRDFSVCAGVEVVSACNKGYS